jgi:hypothetical protein
VAILRWRDRGPHRCFQNWFHFGDRLLILSQFPRSPNLFNKSWVATYIITHNINDVQGSDSMGVRAITPATAPLNIMLDNV